MRKYNGRVIVVEDNGDLRESLVECLEMLGHEVTGVGSALEFYRELAGNAYTIAVVDLGLPDHCGLELVEHIRKSSAMGVIILTARTGTEDRVRGYNSGADLYLLKPVDCRELSGAINNLSIRLGHGLQAESDEKQRWRLVREHWQLVAPGGSVIGLTGKEMKFIACLADAPGEPVARESILAALGYRDDQYASRALDSLVRRLRRKIEDEVHLPSPLKTIHGVGYCFAATLGAS